MPDPEICQPDVINYPITCANNNGAGKQYVTDMLVYNGRRA
ncbi:MAG: hypothetical protein ACUZ8H_11975 [Candidatus Anammoxibacter sp.]